MKWMYLFFAILFEVIATSFVRDSEGFTKPLPTFILVVAYMLSFYFLSLTVKYLPTGITYAIWSAVGIVMISIIAYYKDQQSLDLPAKLGMGLIICGVLVIQIFSKNTEL